MINWIKNLFTSSPAPVTGWPFPTQEAKSFEDTSDIAIAQRPAPAKTCNFDKLTKSQLLAEAKHLGVKVTASMNKADILVAVKSAK